MFKVILFVLVVALCGCCAAPRHVRHRRHGSAHGAVHKRDNEKFIVELPDVLNKTVCPMVQVIDEDKERVPRRIKMLKCAPQPSPVCQQADVREQQACCGQRHKRFVTQCVEVSDHVVVSIQGKLETIRVSVGCTCMVQPLKESTQI